MPRQKWRGGSTIAVETHDDTQLNLLALDWLVSNLRWLWLIFTAAFVIFAARSADNFVILLLPIIIGLVLNGTYAGLLWAGFFPGWLGMMAAMLDIVLAVVLLLLMSDWTQVLLLLAVFPVIMAGARWGAEFGLLMALPIIISHTVPHLPELRNEFTQMEEMNVLLSVAANAFALFAAGLLPGLFIRHQLDKAEYDNNAELARLRVASDRARIISQVAMITSSTLDYRRVLRTMVDLAYSAVAELDTKKDESMVVMVLLFEAGSDGSSKLTVAAGRNIARSDEGRKVNSDEGIFGKTIATADVTVSHNAQNDKALHAFASTRGSRSAMCGPLRAGISTYGLFLLCSAEPDFFSQDHRSLLQTLCSQAIIPLQNAQLFEDLRLEQQKILEKESETRRKLARDLHDGPTQSIAAVVMRLNFIKLVLKNNDIEKAYDELVKVEEIAQRSTQEIRTMLFAMRPVILETQGLFQALQQYVDRLNQTESFQVSLTNRGYEGQLDTEAEGVVFAIIEEAVGNAKKHAQASQIRIMLMARGESLLAEVRDNGVGFDLSAVQSTYDQRTSLGLINMDERAEIMGGECTIESAHGKGTVVRLEVPFKRPVEEEA